MDLDSLCTNKEGKTISGIAMNQGCRSKERRTGLDADCSKTCHPASPEAKDLIQPEAAYFLMWAPACGYRTATIKRQTR
jgi:hypothetical protein